MYQTGLIGDMHQFSVHDNWRTTWPMIVPSSLHHLDLLFYSPTEATGEFYSIDAHGSITLISSHDNWRKTWTIVNSL